MLVRLLVLCAAWALGEALEWQFGALALGPLLPLLLAAAAFMGTRDLALDREDTYWRGRRIDRDRWH